MLFPRRPRRPGGLSHRPIQRVPTRVLLCCLLVLGATEAKGQRADEDVVTEATDAFGMQIGREAVGLYTPEEVRGFSPVQAGNLRIDGLYFDQAGFASLNDRIVRDATVHVGINAQGYPFPAPTGIVDYDLRAPEATPGGSVLLEHSTYDDPRYVEVDAHTPVTDTLDLGGGVGYNRIGSNIHALVTNEWTGGAIASWRPTAGLTITPFWGLTRYAEYGEKPIVILDDSGVPRFQLDRLTAQPWSDYGYTANDGGVILGWSLGRSWLLRAGIFRSEEREITYPEPFMEGVNASGIGLFSISESPPNVSASTSGEVRLSKALVGHRVAQTIYLSVKGRHRGDEPGGADSTSFGQATLAQVPQIVPAPTFHLGTVTSIDVRQLTGGIADRITWSGIGQLTLGLQRTAYERSVGEPGLARASTRSSPWLYDIAGAAFLSPELIAYASATQGFEEIGSAPQNAVNRDEIVPAQLTRQVDAGLEYRVRKNLVLIAGVFEIDKPYFALDGNNVFRQVGRTSNRGAEFSLTGALTDRLIAVAGATLIEPAVRYDGGGSAVAVGPIPGFVSINLQYRLPYVRGLSLESQAQFTSSRYARYDDIALPAVAIVGAGFRLTRKFLGWETTLQVQGSNLTNSYALTPNESGEIAPFDPRSVDVSFIVDF